MRLPILLLILLYQFCFGQEICFEDSINQFSYFHGNLGYDLIILKGGDGCLPYYNELYLVRKDSLLYSLNNKYEFQGYKGQIFKESKKDGAYYYILTINDRPLTNKIFVIITNADTTYTLGPSQNTMMDFVGDIDHDGYVEIGGFDQYNESGSAYSGHYEIFEARDGYPVDSTLTNFILGLWRQKK